MKDGKSSARSFDPIAAGYDFLATLHGPDKNQLFLADPPSKKRAALDLGCGSGVLAEALSSEYGRVLAVDISEEMLRIARAHHALPNIEYVLADVNSLELEERFDLICSANTFHHLGDPESMLARLRNLLHPGGRLVILDNVASGVYNPKSRLFAGRPPSWIFLIAPFVDFRSTWKRFGFGSAIRVLRFTLSRPWRDHLAADLYLTEDVFREVYGNALPGCEFIRFGAFILIRWRAPEIEDNSDHEIQAKRV